MVNGKSASPTIWMTAPCRPNSARCRERRCAKAFGKRSPCFAICMPRAGWIQPISRNEALPWRSYVQFFCHREGRRIHDEPVAMPRLFSEQLNEDLVRLQVRVDAHLQKRAVAEVERCLGELLRVHLTQSLEAGNLRSDIPLE